MIPLSSPCIPFCPLSQRERGVRGFSHSLRWSMTYEVLELSVRKSSGMKFCGSAAQPRMSPRAAQLSSLASAARP